MCLGQIGSLVPHVVVPSILAAFLIPEWHLSGAQAGLLAGSGAAGYMLTVPVLATLTDRIDARKILIAGSAVSALGTLLFGLFATGLWSGALFNAIAGVGFAGAYMPGLKALTDRLAPGDSSRAITLYTSSFSFGVGVSFLVSQLVAEAWGWRSAFFVTATGPLVMLTVCLLLRRVEPKPASGRLLDFAPVFQNRKAMGFVLGYGAHCFELYGIRTWIVAFWTFVAARSSNASILTPIVISVVFSMLAMPASILGNEFALRFGRHRAISAVMFASAAVALLIGLLADKSPWLLLPLMLIYAITVPADSGALTSGMSMAAEPNYRGATMAMHSTVGFSLSALGAWAVGIALDAAGGPQSSAAWMAAFSVLAAGILLGPLALYWSGRETPSLSHSAPPRRWPGLRATTCRRSSPIRSRAISAFPRTGSLPPSQRRSSSRPCSGRASAGRSIWSAAVPCCRFPTSCWPRGLPCSASPIRYRCCSPPGFCSASAWGRGFTTPPSARSAASTATRPGARSPASP
jgi:predicted MFS family arabinose efflux permease